MNLSINKYRKSPPTLVTKYLSSTCKTNGCRPTFGNCNCFSKTVYSIKRDRLMSKKECYSPQTSRFHSEFSSFSEGKELSKTNKSIMCSSREPKSSPRHNKIKFRKEKDDMAIFSNIRISQFVQRNKQEQRQKQFMFPMPSLANQILSHKKAKKLIHFQKKKKSCSLDNHQTAKNRTKTHRQISIFGQSMHIKDSFSKYTSIVASKKVVICNTLI